MTRKLLHVLVLASVVMFLFACPIQANTLGPLSTTTPISSALTDWTGTLSFPQFDSSLGTLLSVELDLSSAFSTQLTVTNTSPEASSGTAKTEVQVSVQDPLSNLIEPAIDANSPNYAYSLASNTSVTSGVLTKNASSVDLYTLAPVLSEFTGVGTIVLNASTFTQTWLTNTGGNTYASQVTNASLTGSVTYNYTPIPEPSTIILLGMGAFGLLAWAWRRSGNAV